MDDKTKHKKPFTIKVTPLVRTGLLVGSGLLSGRTVAGWIHPDNNSSTAVVDYRTAPAAIFERELNAYVPKTNKAWEERNELEIYTKLYLEALQHETSNALQYPEIEKMTSRVRDDIIEKHASETANVVSNKDFTVFLTTYNQNILQIAKDAMQQELEEIKAREKESVNYRFKGGNIGGALGAIIALTIVFLEKRINRNAAEKREKWASSALNRGTPPENSL